MTKKASQIERVEQISKRSPLFVIALAALLVGYVAYKELDEAQDRNYSREIQLQKAATSREEEAQKRVDAYMEFMQTAITKIEENQSRDAERRSSEMQYIYSVLINHASQIEEVTTLLIDFGLLPLNRNTKTGIAEIQTPRFRAESGIMEPGIDKHRYFLGLGNKQEEQ